MACQCLRHIRANLLGSCFLCQIFSMSKWKAVVYCSLALSHRCDEIRPHAVYPTNYALSPLSVIFAVVKYRTISFRPAPLVLMPLYDCNSGNRIIMKDMIKQYTKNWQIIKALQSKPEPCAYFMQHAVCKFAILITLKRPFQILVLWKHQYFHSPVVILRRKQAQNSAKHADFHIH